MRGTKDTPPHLSQIICTDHVKWEPKQQTAFHKSFHMWMTTTLSYEIISRDTSNMNFITLQGTNISHLGKAGKSSTQKVPTGRGYGLVPRRVFKNQGCRFGPEKIAAKTLVNHQYLATSLLPSVFWRLVSEHVRKRGQISNQLVVSTHLKNMSQNGNLPQVGMEINKNLKPPPSATLKMPERNSFFWHFFSRLQLETRKGFFWRVTPRF